MRILFTFILLMLVTNQLYAQSRTKRYDQINALADGTRRNARRMVAPYILDSILGNYQRAISGTQVKEGKLAGSSITLTDKGASAQIGFAPLFDQKAFLSLTVGGRGDDKFVDLVKKGEYKSTITGGAVLNIFPRISSGFFRECEARIVKTRITQLRDIYDRDSDQWAITGKHDFLINAINQLDRYEDVMDNICNDAAIVTDEYLRVIDDGKKALDTLNALELLPKNYAKLSYGRKAGVLSSLLLDPEISADTLKRIHYIRAAEAIQMTAPWNAISLHWITISLNYNIAPQPIIDINLKDKDYLRSFNSEYVTASVAYNYTRVHSKGKQFQYTLSPMFSLSSERQFKDDDKISINKTVSYTQIPNDTVSKRTLNTEGFEQIAVRKLAWNVELPLILFWNKSNIGIELAAIAGMNNRDDDNTGARLGVYIPVQVKDDTPVWIEPVFKLGKLFNARSQEFWKDNVTVGFNISVALKKVSIVSKK